MFCEIVGLLIERRDKQFQILRWKGEQMADVFVGEDAIVQINPFRKGYVSSDHVVHSAKFSNLHDHRCKDITKRYGGGVGNAGCNIGYTIVCDVVHLIYRIFVCGEA